MTLKDWGGGGGLASSVSLPAHFLVAPHSEPGTLMGMGVGVDTEETSRREGGGRSRASICWTSFWLTLSHKLLTRNLRFFLTCR